MNAPIAITGAPSTVVAFPVQIPAGFAPTDCDGDGDDKGPTGKVCAGYDAASGYRPRWGGGFDAPRGPQRLAHRAIDIMAAEGALVVAPSTCVVLAAATSPKGGHHVYLRDLGGWVWYMAHMRDVPLVVDGAELVAGDVVGYVGRTGNAVRKTAAGLRGCPHLHLSLTVPRGVRLPRRLLGPDGQPVARRGEKVDPVPYLRPVYDAGGWRRG